LGNGRDNGTDRPVKELENYFGDLCVGGGFTIAGSLYVNFFAIWDGSDWSTLGNGFTDVVYSMTTYNYELYAAAYGVGVCRWDGSNWIGFGLPWTFTLAADDNYLYAGGQFYENFGAPGNCIARWDGQDWSEMGSGIGATGGPFVQTIDIRGDDVFVGGAFTYAGGKPSYFVARWNDNIVEVNEDISYPREFSLVSNYPNPFNNSTVIEFSIPEEAAVKIDIFDVMGKKIETIFEKTIIAGKHRVTWNAEDVASGIYFYRIKAGNDSGTFKMALLK
jgi:hypothetical protein